MHNSRLRGYLRDPRERRPASLRVVYVLVPVMVVIGMCAIPVASQAMGTFASDVFAMARDLETLEGIALAAQQDKAAEDVQDAKSLSDMTASIDALVPVDSGSALNEEIKKDLLPPGDSREQRRARVRKIAAGVATGNYVDIPKATAEKLRARLGPATVKALKDKLRALNPSPDQLMRVAGEEAVRMGIVTEAELKELTGK